MDKKYKEFKINSGFAPSIVRFSENDRSRIIDVIKKMRINFFIVKQGQILGHKTDFSQMAQRLSPSQILSWSVLFL